MSLMDQILADYLAIDDAAGREQFLLQLLEQGRYYQRLNREVAKESPELIARIIPRLYQLHSYFFGLLVCDIISAKGIGAVADILKQSNFASLITPTDISRIDIYYASDSNPLHFLYERYGSGAFIVLYDAGVISLRQLYLWVRADDAASSSTPQSEQFVLALAEHYARDFAKAPSTLTECFIAECDIAAAQGKIWYLKEHLPLLNQILSRLGRDGFRDFLTHFGAKLRCRPAYEAAENLLYCEFLKYAVLAGITIHDQDSLCPRFWYWVLSHSATLSDLRDLLLSAISEFPR